MARIPHIDGRISAQFPRRSPGSEAESFSSVAEQRARRRPIKAQSTAIAGAMANICNAERASSGVMSGHDRKILSLSAVARRFGVDESPGFHLPGAH